MEYFTMKNYAFRIEPNRDLKLELINIVDKYKIESGFILTCVGSLKKVKLRLSNLTLFEADEEFEILSLSGTLCGDGVHLHISISDSDAKLFGGHLLDGCIVNTTAELVIGKVDNVYFQRKYDLETKFKELVVLENKEKL
jgi:uncharacterized protein